MSLSLPDHLSALSPSDNASRALLGLARQISKRDGVSQQEVLDSEKIVEICLREKLGRKDKLKLVRDFLERKRYPLKAKLEKELSDCSDGVLKSLGVKLELPAEFEGDNISFKVKAKNLSEISTASKKILELSSNPEMARIFAILSGEFAEEDSE